MNIFSFEFKNWYTLLIKINWFYIIVLLVLIYFITQITKHVIIHTNKKSIDVDMISLGIGNSSITLHYNNKDKEIAYKLWVELSTRKIGLLFDKDNDVIIETYNSWYEFFKIARELMKEIPVQSLSKNIDIVNLTEKVLNKELRPHLTKWQAKYRKWYEIKSKGDDRTPQEIQKDYEGYEELVKELLEVNKHMLEYKEILHKIAENK